MPARLLTHPFRILTSGVCATAEQGSDDYITSQLQVIVGTRLGERDMCEPFGIPNPAYANLTAADIQTCLDQFGPDGVTVTTVTTRADTDTNAVQVTWKRG
jgi:hypothetical protein